MLLFSLGSHKKIFHKENFSENFSYILLIKKTTETVNIKITIMSNIQLQIFFNYMNYILSYYFF